MNFKKRIAALFLALCVCCGSFYIGATEPLETPAPQPLETAAPAEAPETTEAAEASEPAVSEPVTNRPYQQEEIDTQGAAEAYAASDPYTNETYQRDAYIYNHYGKTGVYPPTGNVNIAASDMKLFCPGFTVNLGRVYNTSDAKRVGMFGKDRWRFTYECRVFSPGQGPLVLAETPDGRVFSFFETEYDGEKTYESRNNKCTLTYTPSGKKHVLTTPDGVEYTYAKGGLTQVKDRVGNTISLSLSYRDDASPYITKLTDSAGREVDFIYSGTKLSKIVLAADETVWTSYSYTSGHLSSVSNADGVMASYTYYDETDTKDDLLYDIQVDGKPVSRYYYYYQNSYSTIKSYYDYTTGVTHAYEYDTENQRVYETYGKREIIYRYNKWYDITSTTYYQLAQNSDTVVQSWSEDFSYWAGEDNLGLYKYTTDVNGCLTYYEWDSAGKPTKVVNPDGSVRQYAYDSHHNLIMEIDEAGGLTRYVYDAAGVNLVKEAVLKRRLSPGETPVALTDATRSQFFVTTYTYDITPVVNLAGNPLSGLAQKVTDDEGNETELTYDATGMVVSKKDPLTGAITSYTYDALGRNKKEISPLGVTSESGYDTNGNLAKSVVSKGSESSVKRFVYDKQGRLVKQVSPNNYDASCESGTNYTGEGALRYSYTDGFSKPSLQTDAMGYKTQMAYDEYGNLAKKTLANGSSYSYQYDFFGRQTKEIFADNATSTGKTLSTTEYSILPNHNTQEKTIKPYQDNGEFITEYDWAGRVVKTVDAEGGTQLTEYYADGSVYMRQDAAGCKTYYTYDSAGNILQEWTLCETRGGKELYAFTERTYHFSGLIKTEKTAKQKLSLFTVPANTAFYTKTFTISANGTVTQADDSEGRKTVYTYDNDKNIISQQVFTSQAQSQMTEYTYNYLGLQEKVAANLDLGDLQEGAVTKVYKGYTYDKEGNKTGEYLPGAYDENGALADNLLCQYVGYTYDKLGRLTKRSYTLEGPTGAYSAKEETFSYSLDTDLVTAYQDAAGRTMTTKYDVMGNIVREIYPDGSFARYYNSYGRRRYAAVSPQQALENADLTDMNRVSYTYDKLNRLVDESFMAAGDNQNKTPNAVHGYDGAGNEVKKQDGEGVLGGYATEKTYTPRGMVETELLPESAARGKSYTYLYEYDVFGNLSKKTDEAGVVTTYVNDAQGNVLSETVTQDGQAQTVRTCTYDYLGHLLTETDANGNTTTYTYNKLGKVKTKTYPSDETIALLTETYFYDKNGNVAKVSKNTGKTTTYTYNNQGAVDPQVKQQVTTQGSESTTLSWRYDYLGNCVEETNANGVVTGYTFDSMNRLVATTYAKGTGHEKQTSATYDKNGNPLTQTNEYGNTKTNEYDAMDRVVAQYDENGKLMQSLGYDTSHRQTTSTDALGHTTQFAYNRDNQMTQKTDPAGNTETLAYDFSGNVTHKMDGNHNVTAFDYDGRGNLLQVTNQLGEVTAYTYDGQNNLLSQTDGAGSTTSYTYNAANAPSGRTDPEGRQEFFSYDAESNLTAHTDRNGNTIGYTYNLQNLVTTVSTGDSSAMSKTYDAAGNVLSANSAVALSRTYDDFGRVLTKTEQNIGTASFSYDDTAGLAAGFHAETSTDAKGNVTKKVYDKTNRLVQVYDGAVLAASYQYYDNGALQKVTYEGGASAEYTYFSNNKLATLTNKNASGTAENVYSYTYDAAGNMLSKTETVGGEDRGTTTYAYDGLNRLITVTEPGQKVTAYTYDAAGNRLSETITQGGSAQKETLYVYDASNRLLQTKCTQGTTITLEQYRYDPNGNIVSKTLGEIKPKNAGEGEQLSVVIGPLSEQSGVVYYAYDALNQMIKVNTGEAETTYAYNAEGYRVSKITSENTLHYAYEYDKVVLEVTGEGAEAARNVYGSMLVSRKAGGDKLYYRYNGHGDVTALINGAGQVVASYSYDAFGNHETQTGTANNPYRYAGYDYDAESGLYYLKARMYNPEIARFLQEDTYWGEQTDPLSLNLYTYVVNNPLIYWDPTGCTAEDVQDDEGNKVIARYAVEDAGGTVVYDEESGMAGFFSPIPGRSFLINVKDNTVIIPGSSDTVSFVVINGRIIMDRRDIERILGIKIKRHYEGQKFLSQDDAAMAFGLRYMEQSARTGVEWGADIYYNAPKNLYYFDYAHTNHKSNQVVLRGDGVAIVHTHPNGNGEFSGETGHFAGTGDDVQSALRAGVDSYLISSGGAFRKFSHRGYKENVPDSERKKHFITFTWTQMPH